MAGRKNDSGNVISINEYTDAKVKQTDETVDARESRDTRDKIMMGNQIRKYRKEAKLSQIDVAEKLSVTRNTVINWESGKYRPDPSLFPALCELLNITLTDLLGVAPGPKDDFSVHEQEIIRHYRQISPFSQKLVDRMIASILDEETKEKEAAISESVTFLAVVSTPAAAGDGYSYSDLPIEDGRFYRKSDRNRKADAIIRVKGDSMLPDYRDGQFVYFERTPSAAVGDDVIISSREGLHIKRLGEDGPYSVNAKLPFTLKSESDNVQIVGRVIGIYEPDDAPDNDELAVLQEVRKDEIRQFMKEHNLVQN
ncbi:MAG: LexA family transcriptional regulator [Clostridia bacterium]|nr:LexA family transcriptional regulator [Clostridia bacterium]